MYRAARRIVEKLRRHNHEAFFAGGWVRDFFLGRKPKDIDIVTSARPEEVQRIFPKSTAVGAAFGVILVRSYGRSFEVATFRSEGPYLDGRHPASVSFAGPREDAQRRDFTVNGLFYDPIAERVIDYVQGLADLRRRWVRTIGSAHERFAEDKLRMLRAVRFACTLDFTIAPETMQAIRQHAHEILQVSWERIRDELLSILESPARGRGLDLLQESGLLARILPEVEALRGVPQPPEYHPEGDVYTHTRMALEMLRRPSRILALAVLLHDIGKPPCHSEDTQIRFHGHAEHGALMAEQVCRRLRMSNEDTAQVRDLVHGHLRFMHAGKMRPGTLRRFLSVPNISDHLELHRVDCLSSRKNLENYFFLRRELEKMRSAPAPPPRLLTGDDLIAMGYKPGPIFREILAAVEERRLEGSLKTRDEAVAFIRQAFPRAAENGNPA